MSSGDTAARYELEGCSGSVKDRIWSLGEAPLLLGRDSGCDVVIRDARVSRHHCEIVVEDKEIRLSDLDSRNATLVNGLPAASAILAVGDRIAVGTAVFIVTAGHGSEGKARDSGSKHSTPDILEKSNPYLSGKIADSKVEARPQTVHDLGLLFRLTRSLSHAATTEELAQILSKILVERFSPLALWIARYDDVEEVLHVCASTESVEDHKQAAPLAVMKEALSAGRASIVEGQLDEEEGPWRSVLAAPMFVGKKKVGVLALQSDDEHFPLDKADLEFLLAVAYQSASLFEIVGVAEDLLKENERLRLRGDDPPRFIGQSKAAARIRAMAKTAGRSELSVLLMGETGTGKEILARLIHENSSRAKVSFVPVNCAAIPGGLFASEIFGHEEGAFTGAVQAKPGRLEKAHGGTIFLDEIGDLSLENQAAILRAIELGRFHRVGSVDEIEADFRVVAATNKNLEKAIQSGDFREDLYHRLSGFVIELPPLRKRPSDIPALAQYFLDEQVERGSGFAARFTPEALTQLQSRKWPGNVRELRNCVLRAATLADGPEIEDASVRQLPTVESDPSEFDSMTLRELERVHIARVLASARGNVAAAAGRLGISRSTLYNKIALHEINP